MFLWEGGDGRDKPTSQLHTCLGGEAIEEIRNILEWGDRALGRVVGLWVVTTSSGVGG